VAELAHETYRRGDDHARRAVLRALPLLPFTPPLITLAVEACRALPPVLTAIACENPFPALHFADATFNQMVVKALGVGVPLGRILGLGQRITPELTRLAEELAAERRSAGCSVPGDLELLGAHAQP
jgi:hypothetical protein